MMRSFIFLFSLFLCMNSYPADSSIHFNQGRQYNKSVISENLLKVNIFYYKDFPYRQRYADHKIKGCIKRPAEGIVRCKEFISLIRPENKVNNWLRLQHEKGYLPLTLKEFGITNIQGHINKVTPADISSVNNKIDKVSSPYVPATGIFIRHVPDVREYTFKNIKTNVIFSVKVTPEHPVYSVNRQAFVPVSQLLPEDQLLSENGQKIQLLCRQGVKKYCGAPFNNEGGITSVYNIEASQRHTYFVQSEKLLVHNCNYGTHDEDPGQDIGEKVDILKNRVRFVVKGSSGGDDRGAFLSEKEYTLEKAMEYRNRIRRMHNTPYVRVRAGDERMKLVAVMDYQGSVAPYSRLEDLSLQDGKLTKDFLMVKEKLDDFNFTKEILTQGVVNMAYHIKNKWKVTAAISGLSAILTVHFIASGVFFYRCYRDSRIGYYI